MRCKLLYLSLGIFVLTNPLAHAERRDISVLDRSSSGRTLKISAGQKDGLHMQEAVLFQDQGKKLVAGRIIALQNDSAVAYLVETYGGQHNIPKGSQYNILYGVPLGDIPQLPDNIADTLPSNPQNERFFAHDGKELTTPDLDDSTYEPETKLRPNFPEKNLYSTHHISIGVDLFRNYDVSQSTSSKSTMTLYQGYALRYQYNFRSSIWIGRKVPAWFGPELGFGVYNFNKTLTANHHASIKVMPLSANIKYMIELNKFLRIYPYVGYENNLVQATTDSSTSISNLSEGGIFGGAGASMVMSENIDARFDVGSDGILVAAVVKF